MTYLTTHISHFDFVSLDPQDFERHLPVLVLDGVDVTPSCVDYLAGCKRKFMELHRLGIAPQDVLTVRSLMLDRLVLALAERFAAELNLDSHVLWQDAVMVAVGGYGRREMSLFSDVDLLFLQERKVEDRFRVLTEKILYILWDLRLDVGHALRSLREQFDMMAADHTVFTAVLDARIICGSSTLFAALQHGRDKMIAGKSLRKTLIQSKMAEREGRLQRYGGSVYLLEPNLKEGEGGLRDLQLASWMARLVGLAPGSETFVKSGLLDDEESRALQFAYSFFLRVRSQLHILADKKTDELGFDWQSKIAQELGFVDDPGVILGVEKFMQGYYTIAFQTSRIVRKLLRRMIHRKSGIRDFIVKLRDRKINEHFMVRQGQVATRRDDLFAVRPEALMEIFLHVQELGLSVHEDTEDLIRNNLHLVTHEFRSQLEVTAMFRQMMGNLKNLGRALFAMHAVHFFDAFIPEFRKLRNRVQHDVYHVYTVDTHSIFAVDDIAKLFSGTYDEKFPVLKKALLSVKRPDLLSLGLLFHDIGKGEGGNHSVVGAGIANGITHRLGYPPADQKTVEFLVLSHLIMPHLSQRRDLEDPALISEMARSMKNLDHLNMLYVLTWADIRAVSAEAWTDWKGQLLEDLYHKARAVIEGQDITTEGIMRRVRDVRRTILERLEGRVETDKMEKFLASISPRYVYAHSEDEIFQHYTLITQSDDPNFMVTEFETTDAAMSEVLIYTPNNPRTLALVTGVMLALGINIFSLDVFTLTNGLLFLKMRLQALGQQSLRQAELVDKLRATLIDVFKGVVKVDDLIARRQRPNFLGKRPVQQARTKIVVDNDVSAYYTVMDVYARDRVGLLYEIICGLALQGCYVEVSKISTKVEQVVDTFYIKDIFGHKIISKPKLAEIEKTLLAIIDPPLPETVLVPVEGPSRPDKVEIAF